MPVCNICQGEAFKLGPGDRLSESGSPPRCVSCYSLERHRQLRECLDRVPPEMLSWRRALQFAPDPSLDPEWFLSFEGSQYGEENSLDLQSIDRQDDSYDFISLSSVLEFVPDDRQAFSELARIASPSCIIHCTFTPAADDAATHHYDKPHGNFGRRHLYGNDLTDWLGVATHDLLTIRASATDPVTEVRDPIHFFCRRRADAAALADALTTGRPAIAIS